MNYVSLSSESQCFMLSLSTEELGQLAWEHLVALTWGSPSCEICCSVLMISICPRSSCSRIYGGWPPLSPPGKHLLRCLLHAMLLQQQSSSLPPFPSLTMTPSSRERTRGLIKNKGDLFFWHVKIFHFFFSPWLLLIHTSMKNGLNGLFFFFSASFSSPFLLWVVVYNKAFYII